MRTSTKPAPGPFQARNPSHTGDLLSAEHVADLLGLQATWQANRLWCLGHLAAVSTPDGKLRFFSDSVGEYAQAGLPGAAPRYSTPEEFLRGSEDERHLARSLESKLSDFVSRHPLNEREQRAFVEQRGSSGYRDLQPAGDVVREFTAAIEESHFAAVARLSPKLLDQDARDTIFGLVCLPVVLGYHLRQALFHASDDRPHQFPGGLLEGLFRSQRAFNARLTESVDALGQKRFGYRAGRYSVKLEGAWNHALRAYDSRVVELNVTESVRGADLMKFTDRRSIVLAAL